MKMSTQSIVGAFIATGVILQVPSVSGLVLTYSAHHPHIAAIVTAIIGISTALHNPKVQQALGLEPGDTLTVENPEVAPDGTVKADSAVIQKAEQEPSK